MGVGGIGSGGFTPYTTSLGSGPTTAQQSQEAERNRAATQASQDQQQRDQAVQAGSTTATRGQNVNLVV